MKKCGALIVALCLAALCAGANAQQVTVVTNSPVQMYASIASLAAKGSLEDTAYWQKGLILAQKLGDYADSAQWVEYLSGLIAAASGDLDAARGNLTPLAEAKFEQAGAYLAYFEGLGAQAAGDLRQAIEQYRLSIQMVGDGADEGYVQDVASRLTECMEQAYQSALEMKNTKEYAQAREMFLTLGAYRDSERQAQECMVVTHTLNDLVCTDQKPDRLWLAWQDDYAGASDEGSGGYTVAYAPVGARGEPFLASADTTMVALNDLIPDTQYTISVTARSGQSNVLEEVMGTAKASACTLYNIEALGAPRAFTFDLEAGIESALEEDLGGDSLALPEGGLEENGLGAAMLVSFIWDETQEDKSFSVTTVLRLPEDGAYAATQQVVTGGEFYVSLYTRIDQLLDQVRAQRGSWPLGDAALELYINGTLASSMQCRLTA